MERHCDVLIIGGGVIGLTTAWYLAREGVSVTLVDRGEIGRQASWAGAGILPAVDPTQARSGIDRLRAFSLSLYPELSAQLREQTGIDNGYLRCGGIELPDPMHPSIPSDEWHGEGTFFERLDRASLLQHIPGLATEFQEGVYLPDMAQVRNPWHLRALESACHMLGVTILSSWPLEQWHTRGDQVLAIEGPRGRLTGKQVLLASGAWSSKLLSSLGSHLNIRPIRGQMILFQTGVPGIRPLLLQGNRYLVPRTDGRVLAGSTEEDVGFNTETTEPALEGLRHFAIQLLPELASAPVETSWAGLRPGTVDGRPYLGRVAGWTNLFISAGHFRSGVLLSPGSGYLLARLLLGRATPISLEEFRPDRGAIPIHHASR